MTPQGAAGMAPPPAPPSSLPAVIGVLNIVFALLCGCGNFVWKGFGEGVREGASMSVAEIRGRLADTRIQVRDETTGEMREQELPEQVVDRMAVALKQGMERASRLPQVSSLELFATLALALQGVLLLSGTFLMGRRPIGRTLGIIACLGLLVVYMLGADASAQVMRPVMEELAQAGADIAEMSEQDVEAGNLVDVLEMMQDDFPLAMSFGTAAFFSLYPLIAGLVLVFSRRIKESLAPPPETASHY